MQLLTRMKNTFSYQAKVHRLEQKLARFDPQVLTEAEQWSEVEMALLLTPAEDAPEAPVVLTPMQRNLFFIGCAMGVMMPTYYVVVYGTGAGLH